MINEAYEFINIASNHIVALSGVIARFFSFELPHFIMKENKKEAKKDKIERPHEAKVIDYNREP